MEKESADYGAYTFDLNGPSIHFRIAKITPTKVGQFVTFWKRSSTGITEPYDFSDPFDFLIVNTRRDHHLGQFIFPKAVLAKQGVLSLKGIGGKRAIRVYPSWDQTLNKQAQKTQSWQKECFVDLSQAKELDIERVKMLFLNKLF